jgi:hypothetical protein
MTKREYNSQPEMLEGAKLIGAGAATIALAGAAIGCYRPVLFSFTISHFSYRLEDENHADLVMSGNSGIVFKLPCLVRSDLPSSSSWNIQQKQS